jgi:hypothetical protein
MIGAMTDTDTIAQRYIEIWNETDTNRRRVHGGGDHRQDDGRLAAGRPPASRSPGWGAPR